MPAPLLLSCQNLGKAYGVRALFQGITLGLYEGDRVGVFGPNGAGKSTFLKILGGLEEADEGTLEPRRGLRVGYVPQLEQFSAATPREELRAVLDAPVGGMGGQPLEDQEKRTRVAIVLTRIGFSEDAAHGPDAPIAALSGGRRKRLALARALVREPDLLLLDEPTNHLDLEGILWLEGMLKGADFAFLVVTHDRYFLENVTTRMLEINPLFREGYLAVPGSYSDFLERRAVVLEAQAKEQQTLKQKVKEEIAWLKRGPKAQRNKNKSRIKDAASLIEDFGELRQRTGQEQSAGIDFSGSERKTRKLLAAHSLVKTLGDRLLINKLNLVLAPGMKLGVLGPNGSGKSTLLKLLTGELAPDAGTVKRAPDLRIVYFDQARQQLDGAQLLRQALASGGGSSDAVHFQGQLVHVSSYARRFLFRQEQLDRPVGELSGGEQARVLIAQLMLTPADVLILDEPTNDLDITSLEVLEQSLEEFPGALVLVTHDRFMLDRLATDIVGLDGFGRHALLTDYDQYRNWTVELERQRRETATVVTRPPAADASGGAKKPRRKLTFAEQRELDGIEARILEGEAQVQEWHKRMEDPGVMADRVRLTEVCEKVHAAQEAVAALYQRWQDLEAKLDA